MEQSFTAWLLPALALIAGVGIGFLLARLLPGAAPTQVQHQLDEMQERFEAYQSEVVSHFNTSASLMQKVAQNYQDIQDHLAEGANRLALDELSRQRLLAALSDSAQPARERISSPASTEPPKDYAPGSSGALSDEEVLKKA
ncbi:YhcB family protein [Geopseudomonas aromaticivorans]